MEKNKSNNYDWAFTWALIIAAVILLYFTFIYNLPHKFQVESSVRQVNSTQQNIYNTLASYNKDSQFPYVKTDLGNVFFVPVPNEDAKFYKYSGNSFSQIKGSKSINLSLTLSGQKIPVNVSYIEQDGKRLGYGTFVSKEKSKIHKYAFFKLCDIPAGYSTDADLMLLVDFDSKDIFNSDKDYSEIFFLNSKTMQASNAIDIKGRKISIADGTMRDDFSVVNDTSINSLSDSLVFLSSRNYKQSDQSYATDVYSQKKYDVSPKLVAKDVLDNFVLQNEDSILYLKNTDDNLESGFSLIKNNGKEKVLRTFKGEMDDGFLRSGKYMIDKNTMTLYNLYDNSESVLLNVSMKNIYTFAVSPDGKRVVLAGSFDNEMQKLVFYDLSIKRYKMVESNELFLEEYPNLCFIDNNTISYVKPSNSVDMPLCNFVVTWDNIFSSLP